MLIVKEFSISGGVPVPPTASAFAFRLDFCDSPSRGSIPWERGRPARILIQLGIAEHQHDFAGSHHVGGNHNG